MSIESLYNSAGIFYAFYLIFIVVLFSLVLGPLSENYSTHVNENYWEMY